MPADDLYPADAEAVAADASRPGADDVEFVTVTRRPVGADETGRANRSWGDDEADDYHDEHGAFLGECDFVWCPEGLREQDAQLLGPTSALAGQRILEVGCYDRGCSGTTGKRDVLNRDLLARSFSHSLR